MSVSPTGIDVILGLELKGTNDSGLSILRGGLEVVPDVPDLVVCVCLCFGRWLRVASGGRGG